jgi:hypothetical protein
MEAYRQGKTEALGEKPFTVQICVPHGLVWDRTRAYAVRLAANHLNCGQVNSGKLSFN